MAPRLPPDPSDDDTVEVLVEPAGSAPGDTRARAPAAHPWARPSPWATSAQRQRPDLPILVGPPALFPAPWALLPELTLTDAERQEAVCAIELKPLAKLKHPVGLRVGRALHVFAHAALKKWLDQSDGYGREQATFKNPLNNVWTPRSAVRRIDVPAPSAGCPPTV
jgi:hypothetical protein